MATKRKSKIEKLPKELDSLPKTIENLENAPMAKVNKTNSITLPLEVWQKIDAMAVKEIRSRNNMIEVMAREYL